MVGNAHPAGPRWPPSRDRQQKAHRRWPGICSPAQVRVKWCGKSAPGVWRQASLGPPSRASPSRGGGRPGHPSGPRVRRAAPGRVLGAGRRAGLPTVSATARAEKWPPIAAGPLSREWKPTRGQNSAYRGARPPDAGPGTTGARGLLAGTSLSRSSPAPRSRRPCRSSPTRTRSSSTPSPTPPTPARPQPAPPSPAEATPHSAQGPASFRSRG